MKYHPFKLSSKRIAKRTSRVVITPLPKGFGHTLGNALRRCLLSSIPGVAPERVSIEDVKHAFSTVDGLKEEVVYLMLNLKKLRIKQSIAGDLDEETVMTLDVKGPKQVTGADFETPASIEVVNKKLTIANLADKSSRLKMKVWVGKGYGYRPVEKQQSHEVEVMLLDALYSPIRRVKFRVEDTRVGRETDHDKLIMEIETNGTITAKAAVKQASKLLSRLFKEVYKPRQPKKVAKPAKPKKNEVLNLAIEEINLPTRIQNSLIKSDIKTLDELVNKTEEDLLKIRNLGKKSVDVIKKHLKKRKLSLKDAS